MRLLSRLGLTAAAALLLSRVAIAADPAEVRVDALLPQMTLEEKIGQLTMTSADTAFDWAALARGEIGSVLNYSSPFEVADVVSRAKSRLGIPLLVALDVIHGYRTIFPVPLADAASFDPNVTYRSAEISAQEARAAGIALTFAPMSDLARDPRWGRIVEGSGEDPMLAAAFSAARVKGFRAGGLATTVKHFAAYGAAEGGRDYDSVEMSEAQLRDLYLPSYHAAILAGAESVMTAYVALGGIPATANRHLLQGILRGEWGFDRVIMSDLHSIQEMVHHGVAADGVDAMRKAFLAGVDIDMDAGLYQHHLADAVRSGQIPESLVDASTRRVLLMKARLGLFDDKPIEPNAAEARLLTPEARKAARELARDTFVLVQNQSETLPIKPTVRKIAVIGSLAMSRPDQLGPDAGNGHNPDAVTLLEGLKARFGAQAEITYAEGCELRCHRIEGFNQAVETAKAADYVVLALGEPRELNGEGGSRADLRLPGHQAELVDLIAKTGKPIALVLFNGRSLALENVPSKVGAILVAWYPGTEGGNALADVLSGDVAPSGKLPITFPVTTGQVPLTYNHLPTGRPPLAEDRYTSKYVDTPIGPLYPFGWGLSYTEFSYSEPSVVRDQIAPDDTVTVRVKVKNTGDRPGREVVQLYTHQQVALRSRPVRELKGFQKIALAPGEERVVEFALPAQDLAYWNGDGGRILEPGTFDYWVGGSSATTLGGQFTIRDDAQMLAAAHAK